MTRKWCALALFAAASCSRCGGQRSARSAEELLASGTSASIVTAPLGVVAEHARDLASRLQRLPGGDQLEATHTALSAQLGFDPLSRDGLLAAGLDPDRALAIALQVAPRGHGTWVAALPLTKPDAFLQTFDRVARTRAGFATRTDEARGDVRVSVYAREGAPVKVAVGIVRGYAVVARGEDPGADVGATAARKREDALAGDSRLKTARDRLGAHDVVVVAPQGSPLPERFTGRPLPGDAAVGLSGSANGLVARAVAMLPPEVAKRAQATLPGGGDGLVDLLPAEAPIRARLGVSPDRLFGELQRFPQVAEALRGADIGPDALAALEPGVAVSLALRPRVNLGAAIDAGLDVQRRSPFETLQLVALAQVRDATHVRKSLAALAAAMPRHGGKVRRIAPDDYAISYAGGEGVRFGMRTIEGRLVAYALGGGLGPEQLHLVPRTAPKGISALYVHDGAALWADFALLADAVRALPEAAYGSGPQAYVARSLVSQIIEPLRAVRVEGSALASPDALTADLVVGLAPP